MVKKLGILGVILVVVAAAGMVWAESFTGGIPAPQPTVMPAAAPPACVGPNCAPAPCAPPMKPKPKKLTTSIKVNVQYPEPMCQPPICGPQLGCTPPPIPVAVPMWRFIVPWPPFVYYLPVD
jgi:hypothetical protein